MKSLQKWMVALDFSKHDAHVLKYVKMLAVSYKPEQITFTHILARREVPERFRTESAPTRSDMLKSLNQKVFQVFEEASNLVCEVHEGRPSFDLWRETHLQRIDLLILGEKNQKSARKIVPESFIRKSFCSVLFVPEGPAIISHIWVPVDFSTNAKASVALAKELRKSNEHIQITCQHVFETPSLTLIDEETQPEYIEYYEEQSEEQLREFVEGDKTISTVSTQWLYVKPSDHIRDQAELQGADLIVMGSGGKNRFSSLFLGSNTTEMVHLEKSIPVLILKTREDTVKAWDILSNLGQ
ncbi:MAG: nucleotide-binding universal stress UspA family protein [Cyclobacteriaceae bacterium]|jgi:nucleotide-binding universal stress UspA family protein